MDVIVDSLQATLRGTYVDDLQTCAADEHSPAMKVDATKTHLEEWQLLLDSTLIEWGQHPELLVDEDEDIDAPSARIVSRAYLIAMSLSKAGAPCPDRIIPDGEGGFVFKWRDGKNQRLLELSDNGALELVIFQDGKVASSTSIPLPEFE